MKLWQKDCFELNQVERSISTNVYKMHATSNKTKEKGISEKLH